MAEVVVDCNVVEPRNDDEYNMNLHIASVFILFAASIGGSILPVLSKYVPRFKINDTAMSYLNAFGIGVVISTAVVHLIPPAFNEMNDPCLGLVEEHEGMAMIFVMITMLLMQLFENESVLYLSRKAKLVQPDAEKAVVVQTPHSPHDAEEVTQYTSHGHSHGVMQLDEASQNLRTMITVIIFEIGVSVHSVIIGVDLGVTGGDKFVVLLVALIFHQFFEGIAVGTSAVSAFPSVKAVVFTAFGYSVTTPLGVVIGILVSGSYAPRSYTGLWVKGVLDAVAAGVLIYAGVVELLTYQYTMNPKFHNQKGSVRFWTYFFMYLGASLMAVIGKWA